MQRKIKKANLQKAIIAATQSKREASTYNPIVPVGFKITTGQENFISITLFFHGKEKIFTTSLSDFINFYEGVICKDKIQTKDGFQMFAKLNTVGFGTWIENCTDAVLSESLEKFLKIYLP